MSNEPVAANDELDPNSSIAYIALSILCSRQSSLIPELFYVLSPQQITTFIKVFSGQKLRIPTVDEFGRDIMASLAAFHIVVEGKSWDWFRLKYSLDGNYINSVKSHAVDEIVLFGVAAEIVEGEHGDRWFVRQAQSAFVARRSADAGIAFIPPARSC